MLRAPRLLAPYTRRYVAHDATARRAYATVTDLSRLPQVGERLHGFSLKRREHIPELELSALHFHHEQTGAEYLHVARDDSNNVFSIGFKTNPPDATGVPHILEHVTLCGSEKYPVRDPFFKMMPRSLQNFMNAFTSSDYTMYPFATTNPQDFRNLQSVYLDATLKPLLKPSDFVQEGWRLGPEDPSASPSADAAANADDIVFKGVVYNEMKGQMSDANYLFYIRFMEHLIPSLNNSGGDPQKMTALTYAQLKAFHQQHYHPSNARIITYGDQPVQTHLETLGQALQQFEKVAIDTDIKTPISLAGGPQTMTAPGPVDPLTAADAQYKTSTTWLMGTTTDIAESFALRIATTLLLDGYGSPMYQALIESGLGTDFTPNTGYDTSGPKGVFSIGLTGVTEANVPQVREVVKNTVSEVAAAGLDKAKVQGLLHQLELGLKHKTATFGMDLVQRLKPGWFNGINPFDALAWNKTVEHFKAEFAAKPTYLEDLLRQYLLVEDTLTFTMVPTATYGEDLRIEEQNRLQAKVAEAIAQYPSQQEALDDLRKREATLQAEQEAGRDENLECLPSLRVTDIPRQKEPLKFRDQSATDTGFASVQWYNAPTNGLTYFRSVIPFESQDLTPELRMLLPLFTDALLRIGTKDKSMGQIEDMIKLHTGGLNFGYHVTSSPENPDQASEGLVLASYALQSNLPKMYDLIRLVLLETDFASPKARAAIKELVTSSAASAMDAISDSGHAYARRFAEAGISPAARMSEATGGITQVRYIARLAALAESGAGEALDEVMLKLQTIQALLAQKLLFQQPASRIRVAVTCAADHTAANELALEEFVRSCRTGGSPALTTSANSGSNLTTLLPSATLTYPIRTLLPTPFQISHVGLACRIPGYTSPASAAHAVLAQILTHKLLHPSIREQGGAYGAGAYANPLNGAFGMYTYRDPNPARSHGVLREAGRWALARLASKGAAGIVPEMDEAKMLIFQGVDAPFGIADAGMRRLLSGVDEEMQARRRAQLLDVRADQVMLAAEELVSRFGEEGAVRWAVLGKGFDPAPAAGGAGAAAEAWERVDIGVAGGEAA